MSGMLPKSSSPPAPHPRPINRRAWPMGCRLRRRSSPLPCPHPPREPAAFSCPSSPAWRMAAAASQASTNGVGLLILVRIAGLMECRSVGRKDGPDLVQQLLQQATVSPALCTTTATPLLRFLLRHADEKSRKKLGAYLVQSQLQARLTVVLLARGCRRPLVPSSSDVCLQCASRSHAAMLPQEHHHTLPLAPSLTCCWS